MSLKSNIRKAHNYMKKNGLKSTIYASIERLAQDSKPYVFLDLSEDELEIQRKSGFEYRTRFSIVVPMYETNEKYAHEMIKSALNQTYGNFELLLADASTSDKVEKVVRTYDDARVNYIRLTENKGISENTNAGIRMASGDYIGLLDHDDLLTPDALYEMARFIEKGKNEGREYSFIYSDEDKCDSDGQRFYEPNYKPKFNLDLILTNNYICHFMVMKAEIMKKLMLRSEFDGAQDHDLVIRAYAASDLDIGKIDKVLYHWRCHEESTASNPESKLYAYEAGRKAVLDYLRSRNVDAAVMPTKHNGFFRVHYGALTGTSGEVNGMADEINIDDIFKNRFDIGVIGGPLVSKNKITGGILNKTKTCPMEGKPVEFSGYMHRDSMQQDAFAVDIRNMYVRDELIDVIKEFAKESKKNDIFNLNLINGDKKCINVSEICDIQGYDNEMIQDISVALCERIRMEGYLIFFDPLLREKV